MSTHGPPKETGGLLHAPSKKVTTECYHRLLVVQVPFSWQREASRLASKYVLKGRDSDLLAFERHMGGILFRVREAIQ